MNFVSVNKIDDINDFLYHCLRDGFNIAKYGLSPEDNFNKENKPFEYGKEEELHVDGPVEKEKKPRGRKRKEATKEVGEQKEEGEEVVKVRKTIKIIKK